MVQDSEVVPNMLASFSLTLATSNQRRGSKRLAASAKLNQLWQRLTTQDVERLSNDGNFPTIAIFNDFTLILLENW